MDPRQRRLDLLQRNRAKARAVYEKSLADGVVLPVVLVIDTADPAGCALLEGDPVFQAHRSGVFVTAAPLAALLAEDGPLKAHPPWRRAIETVTRALPAWQRSGEGWAPASPTRVHIVAVVAEGGFGCHPVPLEVSE